MDDHVSDHPASGSDASPWPAIPDAAFDAFATLIARALGTPAAMVSVLRGDLELIPGAFGVSEPLADERQIAPEDSLTALVAASGRPLVARDTEQDAMLSANPVVRSLRLGAYAAVPVLSRAGDVIGSVAVSDDAPRDWTLNEVGQLTTVAELVAAHIELQQELRAAELANLTLSRAYTEAQEHTGRRETYVAGLESLLAVAQRLALLPDAREGVCEAATELADASVAMLWEPIDDRSRLAVTAQHAVEERATRIPPPAPLHAGVSAESDAFLTATSGLRSATSDGARMPSALGMGIADAVTVVLEPVIAAGQPIGLLEVGFQRPFTEIPASALALIGLLTIDAAAAITRSRAPGR